MLDTSILASCIDSLKKSHKTQCYNNFTIRFWCWEMCRNRLGGDFLLKYYVLAGLGQILTSSYLTQKNKLLLSGFLNWLTNTFIACSTAHKIIHKHMLIKDLISSTPLKRTPWRSWWYDGTGTCSMVTLLHHGSSRYHNN